jgi:peptidoglycan/LPS O-acetylase OafA/YrhL
MHALSLGQWLVVAGLGVLVALLTAGVSYLINEWAFRRRTARWDRELNAPDAPADVVDIPQQRDGNGA